MTRLGRLVQRKNNPYKKQPQQGEQKLSPDERRAAKMRNASLLLAAYLGARQKMTPGEAYAAALFWVAGYSDYLAGCTRREYS